MPEFPTSLRLTVDELLRQIPPQWRQVGKWGRIGPWIDLAALIEFGGLWDEAWDVLALLSVAVERAADDELAHFSEDHIQRPADPAAHRTALLAFLIARRGRVARLAGRLDTAAECYREALMRAESQESSLFWEDVYPSAWIGRCVLAVERGNYPQARAAALRAVRETVPRAHRAQAHQMLALIDRKAGRFDRALHHLWEAHDQTDGHPMHRAEILLSLAEVAQQLGDHCASLRARLFVLQEQRAARIVIPALAGLIENVTNQLETEDRCGSCYAQFARIRWFPAVEDAHKSARKLVQLAAQVADGVVPSGLLDGECLPHDVVVLQIACARLLRALGEVKAASDLAMRSRAEAQRLGFYERVFQSESLEVIEQSSLSDPPLPDRIVNRRVAADLARCFSIDTRNVSPETVLI